MDFNDPVWKQYRRLGYLGLESIRRLLKQSYSYELTNKQIRAKLKVVCPVCAITKVVIRIPRDPADRRFKEYGKLLIIDTQGLYPILGLEGERYALFVIDDATRYSQVQIFYTKDEIPILLRNICKLISTVYNVDIRRIRFNNEFDV